MPFTSGLNWYVSKPYCLSADVDKKTAVLVLPPTPLHTAGAYGICNSTTMNSDNYLKALFNKINNQTVIYLTNSHLCDCFFPILFDPPCLCFTGNWLWFLEAFNERYMVIWQSRYSSVLCHISRIFCLIPETVQSSSIRQWSVSKGPCRILSNSSR